jgi:hypothetical protein
MNGFPKVLINVADTVTDVHGPVFVVGGYVDNLAGDDAVVVFFNKPASEVTLGTTVPDWEVRCYALSQSPVVRAGEAIIFDRALSIASVDAFTGNVARPSNVNLILQ